MQRAAAYTSGFDQAKERKHTLDSGKEECLLYMSSHAIINHLPAVTSSHRGRLRMRIYVPNKLLLISQLFLSISSYDSAQSKQALLVFKHCCMLAYLVGKCSSLSSNIA
jgi:hypothetical protein